MVNTMVTLGMGSDSGFLLSPVRPRTPEGNSSDCQEGAAGMEEDVVGAPGSDSTLRWLSCRLDPWMVSGASIVPANGRVWVGQH
jgi:hypothetical protein